MKLFGWKKIVLVASVVVIGVGLRLYFMYHMPFTNDEGAYLYDAKTILAGSLPGGDVVAKSPVVILIFAFFVWFTNGSLYAVRIASLVFGLATLFPLLRIVTVVAKKHWSTATVMWLVFSAPVVLMSFGHTEAIACFFAVATLAFLVLAFRREKVFWWAFLSGVSFVLALGSRKINLVLIVPVMILALQNFKNRKLLKRVVFYFAVGFIVSILLLGALMLKLYGWAGLAEFMGGGYAHIVGRRLAGDAGVNIWGINILDATKIIGRVATAHVVLVLLAVVGIIGKFIQCKLKNFKDPLIAVAFWGLALAVLYAVWPTFLPDYAVDFLVPITILGAWVVGVVWEQNSLMAKNLIVICFVLLNSLSFYFVATAPWTGMFTPRATEKMAEIMKNLVPQDKVILTGATIVPYLSGHRTLFNISHPLWYRYEFISEKEKSTFLPSWEEVASAVRDGQVQWILMEHLTDYAYFRNTDQLINEIGQNWELVATVPNDTGFRSNTLKLYRRK